MGGVTFLNSRGCSLIDYLLCRSDLINKIADFRSSVFTTFSDRISFIIKFQGHAVADGNVKHTAG